ncbi:MAG: hypothetical protein QM774_00350 [Gordonia sp. (in: high G+C Gram-positive bacteria)]|uniref:hypothetical protein n=1 Tax=Gordonia sp. (in: high G+C Gram-positive bacteria) TaxID=84139 RepID=UPI0039E27EEA
MSTAVTIVFIVIIATALIAMLYARRNGGFTKSGPVGAGYEEGKLTITGVSGQGAADKNGAAYNTFTGTILGPSIAPTEVYGTLTVGAAGEDPAVGQELPVVYKPGKVTSSWRFGSLQG